MTPADFDAFLSLCKERHGWTAAETAERLGLSKNMPAKYRLHGAPKSVALACAAVDAGLAPFTQPSQTPPRPRA